MDYWQTILLGIVQGVAEFLPISSSGHLVILETLLGGSVESLELNVALHFGTLLSILVVYRNDLFRVFLNPKMVLAIIVATLPVVVVGLFMKDYLETIFATPLAAGCGLCVTACLLFLTPKIDSGERVLEEIRLRDALVIGLFQAIAPVPGISRSGSTIVGGLLSGLKREAAAHFSFYIAIPAIGGAAVLSAKDLLDEGPGETPLLAVLAGTAVAFAVGIFALRWLLKLIVARKLVWFAWYCLAVAIITIGISLSMST